MGWTHVLTIEIEPDVERPGRYRWKISDDRKLRDISLYSFATRREAHADAAKFVGKLNAAPRAH
jgi:hypothetical protein